MLSGTPATGNVGTYSNISISVSDGQATTALAAFSIQVTAAPNHAPTITGSPAASVTAGQAYSFQPTASDLDKDTLTFSIQNKPTWATFNSANGKLSGLRHPLTPVPSPALRSASAMARPVPHCPLSPITVNPAPNHAPTISGTPSTAVVAGAGYSFTPAASDADNDTLSFSISNKPSWATFSVSTGQLSGTPTSANVASYSNIIISVSDGKASTALTAFSITVSAAPNHAPTISGSPTASVVAGMSYSFTPTASDADNDTLSFSISNKPSWATFSVSTGQLSGTPAAADVATDSNITISVSDGKATTALAAFSIAVTQSANGNATLSWSPPTSNTDGSTLTNLAGLQHLLRHQCRQSHPVGSADQCKPFHLYGAEPLVGYLVLRVKAYTTSSVESNLSNVASKTIQ